MGRHKNSSNQGQDHLSRRNYLDQTVLFRFYSRLRPDNVEFCYQIKSTEKHKWDVRCSKAECEPTHSMCFTVVLTEETTVFVTVPWEVQNLACVLSYTYLLTLFFRFWDGLETEIATVLLGVFAVSSEIAVWPCAEKVLWCLSPLWGCGVVSWEICYLRCLEDT